MIKNDDDYLKQRTYTNYGGRKMSADEMFKKLGYEKGSGSNLGDGEKFIYYEGHYNGMRFYEKTQKLSINGKFTMQELQAINKKVEELRME